jgi:colanic acid/amylovoran biosynthesis glycosyltransferase
MRRKTTFCAYDKPDSIGGPVTWLMNLLPKLKDENFEVSCLILFHKGNTGPLYEHLSENGIECKTSPFLSTTEENIQWILSCLQEIKPHIFIPNLVVPAYFATAWLKQAGIFTVGVSHSDDPFYHALEKEFINGQKKFRLDSMVCVSDELEKQLNRTDYDVRIKKIPYGVSIPNTKTKRLDDRLKVIYVGRLAEEQKRISDVANAFCKITSEISNIEAIFYGDGPDRKNVEHILAKHGKGLPITLAGSIPAHQIQEALLNAHIIVLLSDFEGLPIAILEAMACGVVPICIEMKSGISEQIKDGVTGFMVNDRDVHFTETIKKLYYDPILWETTSINAKDYISKNFTIELSHENWVQFLNTVSIKKIKEIRLTKKNKLPPVNLFLARADQRMPSEITLALKKVKVLLIRFRIKLGALRRQMQF